MGGNGGPGGYSGAYHSQTQLPPGPSVAHAANGMNGASGANGGTGMAGDDGNPGTGGPGLGGGVFVGGGALTLDNSSVALNTVPDPPGPNSFEGGGVFQSGTGTVSANSSLFAGNTAPVGDDFVGDVTATNSLFQTAPTGSYSPSRNLVGVDPLLSAAGLQSNGGPTETIALKSGSPAIGKASNPLSLSVDQRGYLLPADTTLDVGSFQTRATPDTALPTATLAVADVTAANAAALNPYMFTITFKDNQAVATASLAGSIVVVQPPAGGAPISATVVGTTPSGAIDSAGDAPSELVTYQITPPGGNWTTAPEGTYSVLLKRSGDRPGQQRGTDRHDRVVRQCDADTLAESHNDPDNHTNLDSHSAARAAPSTGKRYHRTVEEGDHVYYHLRRASELGVSEQSRSLQGLPGCDESGEEAQADGLHQGIEDQDRCLQ